MPDLTREFFEHPQGSLGTVYTQGWHLDGDVLLLGDAAHAIVPFHGQGMNCAFEDCAELDAADGSSTTAGPGCSRRSSTSASPNTDAIAQMALENYVEMREAVLDPEYRRKKAGGGRAGEEGSELHPAIFDGDVSPARFRTRDDFRRAGVRPVDGHAEPQLELRIAAAVARHRAFRPQAQRGHRGVVAIRIRHGHVGPGDAAVVGEIHVVGGAVERGERST